MELIYGTGPRGRLGSKSSNKFFVMSLALSAFFVLIFSLPLPTEAKSQVPGEVRGKGKEFKIELAESSEISIFSDKKIDVSAESLEKMLKIRVKPARSWIFFKTKESDITIKGLESDATYYKYVNTLENEEEIRTDSNGSVTFHEDYDDINFIFIQKNKSTYFIRDDENGGDCNDIGSWNNGEKICTLNSDSTETIEIADNGITLDGGTKTLSRGDQGGVCVNVMNKTGVTVRNITVDGCDIGIFAGNSNVVIDNVKAHRSENGIELNESGGATIKNSTVSENLQSGLFDLADNGIKLDGADGNTITSNNILNNDFGVELSFSNNNTFYRNTISSNVIAGINTLGGDGNVAYQNNFIDNESDVDLDFDADFNFTLPAQDYGNYWSAHACDLPGPDDNPNICTNAYVVYDRIWPLSNIEDSAPWIAPDQWLDPIIPTDPPTESPEFPSFTQINAPWSSDIYDSSDEYLLKCASRSAYNLTIGQCGCAITSVVNVLHSYGITHENSGNEITPKTLDDWLDANSGYSTGSLVWNAVDRYVEANTNSRVKFKFGAFRSSGNTDSQIMTELERILGDGLPAITQSDDRTHFFVVYGKEDSRYLVQDPTWYETMYLDQEEPAPHVRNYENKTAGVHSYVPADQSISLNSMMIILGSPAEILVTDPIGRRLGVDPTTGIRYEEIPDGYYWKESFIDPALIDTVEPEDSVYLYVDDPIEGDYSIDVIGTDEGEYSLGINAYNDNSEPNIERHSGITQEDKIDTYSFVYGLSDNNDNDSVDKISICHIPSGNPENAREINIGEPALDAHINHGDVEGGCDSSEAQEAIADKIEERNLAKPPKIR